MDKISIALMLIIALILLSVLVIAEIRESNSLYWRMKRKKNNEDN